MEALAKFLYYASSGICAFVLTFFVIATLYSDDAAIRSLTHKLTFLGSGCVGGLLLWLGWQAATGHGHWVLGAALSVAALVVSGALVLIVLLFFTNIHWQ